MKYLEYNGLKNIPKAPWAKYHKNREMNVKIHDISVYNYFEERAISFGYHDCIDYYGNKINYNELLKMIDSCAKGFYNLGIRKGDVVTICLPNTIEGIVSFFAINKIGGIVNFIHPLSSENEIKNSLNEVDGRVLVLIDLNYIKVKNIINETKLNKVIIVNLLGYVPFAKKIRHMFKEDRLANLSKNNLFVLWNVFLSKSKKLVVDNYVCNSTANDPAIILHSGGTTGTPKGVVLSNNNLISYIEISMANQTYLINGDKALSIMPIFHGFGLVYGILFPLCIGMQVVLRPRYEVQEYCKMLLKHKPQVIMGVPTLFESLLTEWNYTNTKLDFLKCVLVGGDSLKPVLRNRINTFLQSNGAGIRVIEGYGLSEAVCGVVQGIKEEEVDGTTGIPLSGIYVGIFSDKDEEVPYGEEGEICVCGPTVMLGYYNNEEETDMALHVHKDGNVWLHTGDLGIMHENGFVSYIIRKKRMIISSGYNIYPNRIEKLLESHPAVKQCSVVGIKHPRKIEVPKAYIVLNEGFTENDFLLKEFKKICSKNLPKYSWPYEYEFTDRLSTTKVGKIDYRKLQNNTNKSNSENSNIEKKVERI